MIDEHEEEKAVETEVSDDHLERLLEDEAEDEAVAEETTDEFGNPKEEEKIWE